VSRRLWLAPIVAFALLCSPASLLACGWDCVPQAAHEATRPEAQTPDCHGTPRDADEASLTPAPHDCALHAPAVSGAELATPRQATTAAAWATFTAASTATVVTTSRHAPTPHPAPPPQAPPASPLPLRI